MHWGWGETSSRTLEFTRMLGGWGETPPLNTGGITECPPLGPNKAKRRPNRVLKGALRALRGFH